MDSSFLIQWNCNGIFAHIEELKHLISQFKPSVICIQETLLRPTHTFNLAGYMIYRTDGDFVDKARGGVMICVDNRIHSEEILINNCDLEVVAVKIFYPIEMSVCNLYLPPQLPLHINELDNIKRHLLGPLLFLGDFNAHNHIWGSATINRKGKMLEDFISNHDLIVLNSNSPTHFSSNGTSSIIDLTVASPTISTFFTFDVYPDLCSSDHFPILLNLVNRSDKESKRPRWLTDKADWHKFANCVCFDYAAFDLDIDSLNEHVTEQIISAAKSSIPRTSSRLKRIGVPWWSIEIRDAIKDRKNALALFNHQPITSNLVRFKQLKAKARQLIRKAKRESWQKFTSTINCQTSPREVWNSVRRISGRTVPSNIKSLKSNNRLLITKSEIATELGTFFSNLSSSNNFPLNFIRKKTIAESNFVLPENCIHPDHDMLFSLNELENVLQTCKGSSPGPDDIHYLMLKYLDRPSKLFILKFFNYIWSSGNFPKTWSEALVIPISKPNGNRLIPEGFRPISLTNCLCKVMEKLVNRRLCWFLESNDSLFNGQYGFRKYRSTADNISILESTIQNSFSKQESVIAVLLDLEQAYNKTWRLNILKMCISLGISGHLLKFISNFLSNRVFRILLGNYRSEIFELDNGVPQGSILSVILFLVHINSIKNINFPASVKVMLYADDIIIFSSSKNITNIAYEVQISLNMISNWAKGIGLNFSPTKSKSIIFSRRRIQPVVNNLNIENTNIVFEARIKYLGVWLDNKLNWNFHIRHIKRKTQSSLNILRMLSHTKWGANKLVLLRIFKSLLTSKILYGSIAYSSARKTTLKSLNTIYNQGIRLSTGALRTSPIESLICESGLLPIEQLIELELIKFLIKIKQNPKHPLHFFLNNEVYLNFYLNKRTITKPCIYRAQILATEFNFNLNNVSSNYLKKNPPWLFNNLILSNQFPKKNNVTKLELISIFKKIIDNHPNNTCVFTDASKTSDKVGIGIYSPNFEYKGRINDLSSIYNAELVAIYMAIQLLRTRNETNIIIFTDSMSSIDALKNLNCKNQLVNQIQDELVDLSAQKCIKLCWVPGHSGIVGNELADSLANLARDLNYFENSIQIPHNFVNTIKANVWQKWDAVWSNLLNNKMRLIQPSTQIHTYENLSRKDQVVITRIKIGHTLITHKHYFNREPPPICQDCNTQFTINHIFNDCCKYINIRLKHRITSLNEIHDSNKIQNYIEFLKEIGIYTDI